MDLSGGLSKGQIRQVFLTQKYVKTIQTEVFGPIIELYHVGQLDQPKPGEIYRDE